MCKAILKFCPSQAECALDNHSSPSRLEELKHIFIVKFASELMSIFSILMSSQRTSNTRVFELSASSLLNRPHSKTHKITYLQKFKMYLVFVPGHLFCCFFLSCKPNRSKSCFNADLDQWSYGTSGGSISTPYPQITHSITK